MSIRQTAESQNQSVRKRRQAEVVSFEDLLAAHQVDREPGKLPPEGVVLIGVDRELQERMRAGFPASAPILTSGESKFGTSNFDAPGSGGSGEATTRTSISGRQRKGDLGTADELAVPTEPADVLISEPKSEPKFDTPALSLPFIHDPPLESNGHEQNPTASDLPPTGVPHFGESNFAGPDFGESQFGETEEFDIESLVQRRTGKKTYSIQPPTRIEVILSAGEFSLLRWYWENGRPIPGHPHARLVSGQNGEGSRRMAAQAGLVWNTFRNYTRSLSTKYAIDIVRPESNIPRLYVVWHYTAILERLRSAGLTGVMRKNGGCRQLVDDQVRPAPQRADLTVSDLKRMFGTGKPGTVKRGAVKTGAQKPGALNNGGREQIFGSVSDKLGMPNFDPPIRNKEYPSEKEHPTPATSDGVPKFAAHGPVIAALFERTGRTDADAGRTIVKSCIDANPSVTPEEIARLIRGFHIPASITNPVGLMIRTLPARCHGESLANYRQYWRQQDEQFARAYKYEREEEERIAKRVLEDPEATESERDWARGVIGR